MWIPDDTGDIRPEEEEALLRDLESVTSRMSFGQHKGNAFFFTSSGHMGMGTPMMKAGDIVLLAARGASAIHSATVQSSSRACKR
jgi:hypothetical protein